jgi:hypothetical protein
MGDGVICPSKLERADSLEILALEKDRGGRDGIEFAIGHHRRDVSHPVQDASGLLY